MSSTDKGEVNSFALRKVQSAQTSLWDLDQLHNEGLQNNFYPLSTVYPLHTIHTLIWKRAASYLHGFTVVSFFAILCYLGAFSRTVCRE